MSMSVGSGKANSDINITPLVDVVLVLLIIFMVITPILQKGFDTSIPQKAENLPPNQAPQNTIVLQVDAEGNMSVNKQPVTMVDLGEKLGAIYSTRPDKILFVDADDKVNYEKLVKILDICKGPGKVETIGFVLN
jgi:biopolymer transport protein ExbD